MSSKVKIEVDGEKNVVVSGQDSPKVKVKQPAKADLTSSDSVSLNVTSINGDFTENITEEIDVENTDPGIGRAIGKTYSPGVPVESIVRDVLTSAVREPEIKLLIKFKEISGGHANVLDSGVTEYIDKEFRFAKPFSAYVIHSIKFLVDDPDNALIDSEDLVIETDNLTTNPSLSHADLGLTSWSELNGHVIGLADDSDYEGLFDFNFQANRTYPLSLQDVVVRPYPGSFIDTWDLEEFRYNAFFTKVTFRVDTNDITVPEGNVICVGGHIFDDDFTNSFNARVLTLEDVNGDGIYEGSFDHYSRPNGNYYLFSSVPSSQFYEGDSNLLNLVDFFAGAEDISGQSCDNVITVDGVEFDSNLPNEFSFRELENVGPPDITVTASFGECSGVTVEESERDPFYYTRSIQRNYRARMKYASSTGVKDVFSREVKIVADRLIYYGWESIINKYPPGSGTRPGLNAAGGADPVFEKGILKRDSGSFQFLGTFPEDVNQSTRVKREAITSDEDEVGLTFTLPPNNVSFDENESFGIQEGSQQDYSGDSSLYISVPIPYKIDLTRGDSITTEDGFPCSDAIEFVGFMRFSETGPIQPWWPAGTFWYVTQSFHRIYRSKQLGGFTYGDKINVKLVVDHPVEGDTS